MSKKKNWLFKVTFSFSTARPGPRNGEIVGRQGGGEYQVVADTDSPDKLKEEEGDLKIIALEWISKDVSASRWGAVISLSIDSVVLVGEESD